MIPTFVFHSIACCVAILLSSCNSVQQKDSVGASLDSLSVKLHGLIQDQKEEDSIRRVLLKSTFAAGYKQGVSTGINNCDMSIKELELKLAIDSLNFAKFVDASFTTKLK